MTNNIDISFQIQNIISNLYAISDPSKTIETLRKKIPSKLLEKNLDELECKVEGKHLKIQDKNNTLNHLLLKEEIDGLQSAQFIIESLKEISKEKSFANSLEIIANKLERQALANIILNYLKINRLDQKSKFYKETIIVEVLTLKQIDLKKIFPNFEKKNICEYILQIQMCSNNDFEVVQSDQLDYIKNIDDILYFIGEFLNKKNSSKLLFSENRFKNAIEQLISNFNPYNELYLKLNDCIDKIFKNEPATLHNRKNEIFDMFSTFISDSDEKSFSEKLDSLQKKVNDDPNSRSSSFLIELFNQIINRIRQLLGKPPTTCFFSTQANREFNNLISTQKPSMRNQ